MKEELLVKRARRGDADAFCELIEEQKGALYKTARAYLSREEDIADAIQDAILSAFENMGKLKTASYFKTWLTRILINCCKDILRREKKYAGEELIGEIPWEDKRKEEIEFQEVLRMLPEEYRIVMVLYYGEGFNTREIARILDVSENTVKSRLRRGRGKLENVLA